MPYIQQVQRSDLGSDRYPSNPGQLNYLLTIACLDYLHYKTESYQTYNDIIGALECAKLEMYRRKIVAYEDTKILENGDVY